MMIEFFFFFFFTFHPSLTVMFHKQSRGMPSFSDSVFLSITSSLLMIACTPLTSLTQSSGSGGTPASVITISNTLCIPVYLYIYSRQLKTRGSTFHFPRIKCDPFIYKSRVENRWGGREPCSVPFHYEARSSKGREKKEEKEGRGKKRRGKNCGIINKKRKRREKSARPLFKR